MIYRLFNTCQAVCCKLTLFSWLFLFCFLQGCGVYNFSDSSTTAKTFQVNFFENRASFIEPGIDRTFTNRLQDVIQNQTNLNLVNQAGELVYEGEIVEFRIQPTTATANQTAAQNRLTITVNVRFTDQNKAENDFEKRFSFFYDYDGSDQLVGSLLDQALDEVFDRITQDIFNESLANW